MKKYIFAILLIIPFLTDAQNRNNTLKSWVYYELLSIDAKIAEGRFAEAEEDYLEMVNEYWPSKSFDHAIILKNYGFFLIQQDRPDEGLKFLEWSLRKRALEDRDEHHLYYVISQIIASNGDYQKALNYLLDWYDKGKRRNYELTPKGVALIAICYSQLDEFEPAVAYITEAVENSNIFVKSWYELKFALHYKLEDFSLALSTSQDLVRNYPREKKYLEQMGAMFSELDFEVESLSSLEFGLTQNLLEKENDYLLLANFYMYKEVPIEASKVINMGLKRKVIERNADNLETLANAYSSSREYLKAADVLTEASKLSENPQLSFRLGQIELNLSRWQKAIDAFLSAQENGWEEEEGQIEYFIGICFIELEKLDQAVNYLSKARDLGKEDVVEPWLDYINYLKSTAG